MIPLDDWRACACGRSIPSHADAAPDAAGGDGCGMAWRPTGDRGAVEERHVTEVQPGGHLRQDVPAGLGLPNHQMSSEENAMVGRLSRPVRGGDVMTREQTAVVLLVVCGLVLVWAWTVGARTGRRAERVTRTVTRMGSTTGRTILCAAVIVGGQWAVNIVAPPAISENAHDAYANAVRVHLVPALGGHKLNRLEPEHLEWLYRSMVQRGSAAGSAHQVHRTVRAALNEAMRRKHITENVATVARAPKVEEEEVEPYTVDDIVRILTAAQTGLNSARWAIALALGLRQGEALGLKWADIDLDAGTLVVRRNRLRPKWAHGCGGSCGRRLAGHCPQRAPLRKDTGDTKSRAGRRGIGLPDELVALLRDHAAEQERERQTAADLWRESGYVFTTVTGELIHPRTDHKHWKQLLDRSGAPDRRLHDARHTAATVLLLLGVPERTVMGVMGWSNTAMAARYQHITAAIRRDVAERVGGLLWRPGTDAGMPGKGPRPA